MKVTKLKGRLRGDAWQYTHHRKCGYPKGWCERYLGPEKFNERWWFIHEGDKVTYVYDGGEWR